MANASVQSVLRQWEEHKRQELECHRTYAKEQMCEKARSGILPGPAPLGYLNTGCTIAVDEEAAPLVQEAFRLAMEGSMLGPPDACPPDGRRAAFPKRQAAGCEC